jgi:predicted DNA-binding transcriptional regulator AlpA
MNITITIPAKPAKGDTVSLKDAAAALGLTRQAAFHMVRKGTFPVATSLNGTRVRVDTIGLRKALAMKATATSVTVPEAVKRARMTNAERAVVATAAEQSPVVAAAVKRAPRKATAKTPAKRAAKASK